jgi:hypothetical protein
MTWVVPVVSTIVFFGLFLVSYYYIRGFLPGSRLIEVPNSPANMPTETAEFTLYGTIWCPYSQNASNAFAQLKSFLSSGTVTYGGYTITLKSVDCDASKSTCTTQGVDAYPTYYLQTASKKYIYVGPPNLDSYREFLKTALGTEVTSPDK